MKRPMKNNDVYLRIRQILESARVTAAHSVSTAQVMANWLIGQEIVEEEQKGSRRADYGKKLIATLSAQITAEFGKGYSVNNLEHFRDFYLTYPELLNRSISHALRGKSLLPDMLSSADTEGDNPTLGLILCMEKNDAVVQYTLGEDQKKQIFTSRYKLHLPTEAELKAEIQRELRSLSAEVTEEAVPARKRGKRG
jgi:hypothetical protein